jgi:hypothetical protein
VSLDPHELGWHEFWLRIGAIFFVLSLLLLTVLIVGRVLLTAYDVARWVKRKIHGEEEEMSPARMHRALLKLVPVSHRGCAEKLLKGLLAAEGNDREVFVAEYDGQPASVHLSAETAMAACARLLAAELGPPISWDWFEDDCGWVMRRIDLDTDKPLSLLGGKVTRTGVEE